MYVCVRVARLPRKSPISSSTYCKNLLDEVVMGIVNYFLEISVFRKIWVAKVVLPWSTPQNL